MPTEDPRGNGSRPDALRVGGWLETLHARRALPGRPPLVTPPPPRVPVFQPIRPRSPQRRPIALPIAALARIENPRQVRLRIAVTCVAVVAVGTAAFVVLADRAGTAPAVQQIAVADPVTMGAIVLPTSAGPAPTPTRPSSAPVTSASPVHRQAPAPAVGHHTVPPPPPSKAGPVVSGLRVGATVSLEVQGQSGLRVRHQNFIGRVSRIGPASSALDQADSTFVVRAASTAGCVALESVNYPGFFLRHRDFVIHLDRADGSALFRLDSAFCPVATGDGSLRLRSANYPDHFVTAFRSTLYLAKVPAAQATEFTVRAPY